MASDDSSTLPPSPAGETPGQGLTEEVRQLRSLLMELQSQLQPAFQPSLAERAQELQRLGGELARREAELERLRRELEAAGARTAELELEVERWQGAARRGLDEIAEKARQAAERYAAVAAELAGEAAALKAQLEAQRAQAQSIAQARDAALAEVARRERRVRALRARVVSREARRIAMTRTLSWRLTAPLRWLPAAWRRFLLGGARFRRRMLKR